MAKQSFVVSDRLPLPARSLLAVLQHSLKLSKQECLRIIQEGGVKVNGKWRTKSHQMLDGGDHVEVEWVAQAAPLRSLGKQASALESFSVVYEDDSLIVVHKPPNLLTVPTLNREPRTLIALVNRHLEKSGSEKTAYCVHRLDRGVSGLLVFAKSLPDAEAIRDQFAARKPERRYVAIVAGTIKKDHGTIKSYLATDENLNRYSTSDHDAGELAITHFDVQQRWSDSTLVEIELETGRRNQIRVHMAEMGHPILGDPRYRPQQALHPAWPYHRLALHAESLGFLHPRTAQPLAFRSSWPKEFRDFQRRVKKN